MPASLAEKFSHDEVQETSMVDLAHHILEENGEPMLYQKIMEEVAKLKEFPEAEANRLISQLYTEVNIDGRFVCVGKSLWGLKRWYPLEETTDSAVAQHVKDDDSDEVLKEELFAEESEEYTEEKTSDEESFDGDYEDHDS